MHEQSMNMSQASKGFGTRSDISRHGKRQNSIKSVMSDEKYREKFEEVQKIQKEKEFLQQRTS